MELAAHWVALHPAADPSRPGRRASSPRRPSPARGPRLIDEFCIPDVAAMLGMTCDAVGSYLTDVIELRYRLPQLWAGVLAGLVTPWRARLIAQTTVALTPEAAAFVDEQTAWCANRLTPSQLRRLVDHARARFMPDAARPRDRRRGRPAARHLHHRPGLLRRHHAPRGRPRHPRRPRPRRSRRRRCRPPAAASGSTDTLDGRRATALGDLARHQLAFGFDDERADVLERAEREPRSRPRRSCCTPTCPPTRSPRPTRRRRVSA